MKSHLEDSLILQWNIYIYAKKLLFVLFSSHLLNKCTGNFPWTSTDFTFGIFSPLFIN